MNASESVGLGQLALLVVGRTYSSGPGHRDRLDQAAARVGLERILPLGDLCNQPPISMADVSELFTANPLGADLSPMPWHLQVLTSP